MIILCQVCFAGRSNDYPIGVEIHNRSRGKMKCLLGENPLNRSANHGEILEIPMN